MANPKTPIDDKIAALCSAAGLNTILDGIGEGFYAVDCDWRIILFNNEASKHFDRSAEEMIGRHLWEVLAGARETALGRLFVETMESRQVVRSEMESVVFPGRWMAFRLFPLGDGIGVVFRDMTARRSAEAQRDLLVNELEHRIKNTLAVVMSIASQTLRGRTDPEAFRALEARLLALSNAHSMLTRRNWHSADLYEVVQTALGPHGESDQQRFLIYGPPLRIGPKSAVAISMVIHELCTNAAKYGALCSETGMVEMKWAARADRFVWAWRERGGPPVRAPGRQGFGSLLIRSLGKQLSGDVRINYAASGFACEIDTPLKAILDEPGS